MHCFSLPPEKAAEVYDFVTFLQERYGQRTAVDMSDAWSEEDLHDLIRASLQYAERTICIPHLPRYPADRQPDHGRPPVRSGLAESASLPASRIGRDVKEPV